MLKSFGLSFIAIFVALDIIGALPMYAASTSRLDPEVRRKTVNTSMLVAFVVALVFAVLGEAIFRFLGITIFDFKIAGGLVLLLVSLADLVGTPEVEHRATGNTGIVPLAVPLITGPAVLTTLLIQVSAVGYFVTITALAANYVLAWFMLGKSGSVTRLIGKDGTVVASKIAALLLAAIAVAMIRSGVFSAITTFHNGG